MVTTTSSVVVPVDPRHQLDEARLLQYLQASIPGFLPPPATLHVLQVFFHPEYSILCSFTLVYTDGVTAILEIGGCSLVMGNPTPLTCCMWSSMELKNVLYYARSHLASFSNLHMLLSVNMRFSFLTCIFELPLFGLPYDMIAFISYSAGYRFELWSWTVCVCMHWLGMTKF